VHIRGLVARHTLAGGSMKRVSFVQSGWHNRGMEESIIFFTHVESPIGPILLAGDESRLRFSSFPTGSRAVRPRQDWINNGAALKEAVRQLEAYFAGELTEFDLKLEPRGSAFEMAVWAELVKIPYGETTSYGDIATRIGEPHSPGKVSASRAVGAANGANPLPIFIPCHRVIGADGSLTGFGGGLPTKRFLLDLEFRVKPPADTLFAQLV